MSIEYILRRVSSKSGTKVTKPEIRTWLLDFINEAAREIYRRKDIPITLREVYIRAIAATRVVLPPFIGELRAIRSACCGDCMDYKITSMRPKYNNCPWENEWSNWEEKANSPVELEELNAAPGTIVYGGGAGNLDTALIVTIVGATDTSNRIIDPVTMDAASKVWTKSFREITAIRKNKVTDHDVIINNADGNELSVIYADQLEANFKVIDISKYPNLNGCVCPDGTFPIELLYKPALARLEYDNDMFPVQGYDDQIVLKTLQLLAEDQPGQEQRAILMDAKVKRSLKEIEEDRVGHMEKKIKFGPNKLLNMFGGYH